MKENLICSRKYDARRTTENLRIGFGSSYIKVSTSVKHHGLVLDCEVNSACKSHVGPMRTYIS